MGDRRLRLPTSVWVLTTLSAWTACNRTPVDLSEAQMAPVIAAGRPALQACYQAALDRSPDPKEVRLEAALHIAVDGHVEKVQLGEAALPGLRECLTQTIATWRFPAAPDTTHAALPLVFKPEAPADP